MSEDELRACRERVAELDAEAWDRQIESHAADGTLDRLAERSLRDHAQGFSTEL